MGSYSNPSSSSTKKVSNFQTLLQSLTPTVTLRPVPKGCTQIFDKELNPSREPVSEYFTLMDVWGGLEEWSAYGQGTPVTLANGEDVVLYFTPHLSALHLIRKKKVEKDETNINGSARAAKPFLSTGENKSDKLLKSPIRISTQSKLTDSSSGQSSEEEEEHIEACLSKSYFKFYNKKNYYGTAPFFSKIQELAHKYPDLVTVRSIDLCPASWMAIAWYPIYHIPNNGAVDKDLSTAFITYHHVSSFPQPDTAADPSQPQNGVEGTKSVMYENKSSTKMPLYPFGLAAKDLSGDVWFNGASDRKMYTDLNKAAVSWVSKRNFFHHDLNNFSLHKQFQGR